ncbi:hemolysin family protein [Methanolobus sp. ZRKC3]|uniref:hemolysin family protein n=1 Tax=Methanolobus sp. ZRKC3 TaxID=3125786 RepID=UPI0032484624
MSYTLEIIVIVILILLNSIFAMSEFALVSSRRIRLRQKADKGDTGALAALEISKNLTPFLSTIQIGITLIAIFTGAFGGATIARGLSSYFTRFPALAPYSYALGISIMVVIITYLTLVFGELVPKRIALYRAEAIASRVAKPMRFFSSIARPLVVILSSSTDAVLRLLKVPKDYEPSITEEEVRVMLEKGTKNGVFERAELSMIKGVLKVGDLRVESLMTHRNEIIALDLEDKVDVNLQKMIDSGRSYFPAYEKDFDNIIGIVSAKDIMANIVESDIVDMKKHIKEALFVPETLLVLKLLEAFKENEVHIALIADEYGNIQGVITLNDVLEAIVGDVKSLGEPMEMPKIVMQKDGSWLIDGDTPIEKVKETLSLDSFPEEEDGYYYTISGLIMFILHRIPNIGNNIEVKGVKYEVVAMDGNRIDKVLAIRIESVADADTI